MGVNTLAQLRHLRWNNLYPLYFLVIRVINKVLSTPSDLACRINSTDWFERSILFPRYQQWRDRHKINYEGFNISFGRILALSRQGELNVRYC
jgi:hypothetical protein